MMLAHLNYATDEKVCDRQNGASNCNNHIYTVLLACFLAENVLKEVY